MLLNVWQLPENMSFLVNWDKLLCEVELDQLALGCWALRLKIAFSDNCGSNVVAFSSVFLNGLTVASNFLFRQKEIYV